MTPLKMKELAGIQWPPSKIRSNEVMALDDRTRRFEVVVLPHLDAAYNLARWLLRDDDSARDAVQDACLRALRFFDNLIGQAARPWFLAIVRNACYSFLGQRRKAGEQVEFDEERDSEYAEYSSAGGGDPEGQLARKLESARLDEAIERLPSLYREVIVLREIEELPYEEIAQIANVPVGTVMSRLSRGRGLLRARLAGVIDRSKP